MFRMTSIVHQITRPSKSKNPSIQSTPSRTASLPSYHLHSSDLARLKNPCENQGSSLVDAGALSAVPETRGPRHFSRSPFQSARVATRIHTHTRHIERPPLVDKLPSSISACVYTCARAREKADRPEAFCPLVLRKLPGARERYIYV